MLNQIPVECYNGYRGEETPRRFRMVSRWVRVDEVLDRWLSPDHRYFKVLGEDGDIYILRHDPREHTWALTFFRKCQPVTPGLDTPCMHKAR